MNINEKYELYQILDENGYIPSNENIEILMENTNNFEDFENLSEGIKKQLKKWNNKRHAKKRMKQMWKEGKAGPQIKAAQKENTVEEDNPNE